MPHRTKMTCKKKKDFLKELEADSNATRAAEAVGLSRTTLYEHRAKDPEFKKDWEKAIKVGDKALIDEATRRALAGSDTLLIFMIKGRHPEYRDKLIDIPADSRFNLKINTGPANHSPEVSPANRVASAAIEAGAIPRKKRGRPRKVE